MTYRHLHGFVRSIFVFGHYCTQLYTNNLKQCSLLHIFLYVLVHPYTFFMWQARVWISSLICHGIFLCSVSSVKMWGDISFVDIGGIFKLSFHNLRWWHHWGKWLINVIHSNVIWIYGYTHTYAISAYHHWCCEFESRSGRGVRHYVIKIVSALRQVGGFRGSSGFLHQDCLFVWWCPTPLSTKFSLRSVLLVEETGEPEKTTDPLQGTDNLYDILLYTSSLTNFYHIMLYRVHLAWRGSKSQR